MSIGFIPRNDSNLVLVSNWADFCSWVKEAGYDESYLNVNDSKCLELQKQFINEQAEDYGRPPIYT